jgi:hypothetical protein
MQAKPSMVAFLGVFLILNTLFSCADSKHAQECKNMRGLIKDNNTEITTIVKDQKLYPSNDIRHAELDIEKAMIQENNNKLQQNYQIKCGK